MCCLLFGELRRIWSLTYERDCQRGRITVDTPSWIDMSEGCALITPGFGGFLAIIGGERKVALGPDLLLDSLH